MHARPGGICVTELFPPTCPRRDSELKATKLINLFFWYFLACAAKGALAALASGCCSSFIQWKVESETPRVLNSVLIFVRSGSRKNICATPVNRSVLDSLDRP